MENYSRPLPDAERVVASYQNTVYRLAYAYVHSRSDADDVFQEVFLRYFRKRPMFENAGHEKAWFLRVTINCAKKHCTSAWFQKTKPLEDDLIFPTPEESGLNEALLKLAAMDRSIVHLYYYEGYRTDEIAKVLGLGPSNVRTRLTRARRKLANLMKEEANV